MNATLKTLCDIREVEDVPNDLMGLRGNNIPALGWTDTVRSVVSALDQYNPDGWEDCAGEIADSLIPIYYKDKWQEMNDLSLWADNEVEAGADEIISGLDTDFAKSPLWQITDAYLYTYYLNAVNTIVSYINEKEEDSE